MSDGSVIIDTSLDNKELEKQLKGLDSTISKVSKGLSVSIGAIGTAILGIGASALKFGDEYEQASNQLQASTGATSSEMENLKSVMKDVYTDNFGQDMNDVANSIAVVKQQIGDLDNATLTEVTKGAIALRDTFGFDVKESVRAANSLMKQFGITSEEAFNLITQGAQNGLDANGDLLDTVNEYAVQFKNSGYTAEQMFNMLNNGAKEGTWSIDKLGDAIKEYNIRWNDKTAEKALKELGFNADEMAKKMDDGGETASKAMQDVMVALSQVEGEQDRYILGQQLMGTMWEDLGEDTVMALMNTQGEISKTTKAMKELTEIKYDNLSSAVTGIGRQIQTGLLLPIAEKLMPAFNSLANAISESLASPEMQTSINNIANSIGVLVGGLAGFVEKHLPTLINLLSWIISNAPTLLGFLTAAKAGIAIFQNWDSIVKVATKSFELLNKVLKGNPIMLVVGLIITFIGYLVNLYNTNEDFRNKVNEVWNNVKNTIINTINSVKNFIFDTIPNVISNVVKWFSELPGKALQWGKDLIQGFINGIKNMIGNVVSTVKDVANKIWSFLHFSRPEEGPLRDYEKWMPDMIDGLTKSAKRKFYKIEAMSKELAEKLEDGISSESLYKKMKSAVDFETQKLSANLSTTATVGKTLTANIALNQGDIYMDSTKVGRIITPQVTENLRMGGAH